MQLCELNPHVIIQQLNKPACDFTKADIVKFIETNNVEMVNFRYTGFDGRLKTLNFVIQSKKHLDSFLSTGERVDGSSLFPFLEAGSSDLYVVPRFRTAFLNPFTEIPTVDVLCSFYTKDGVPFEDAPENIMRRAHQVLKKQTGLDFEVMGELEYYIISEKDPLFPARDQKGYHESGPFTKWEFFRAEALQYIAQAGGLIKYGHSEVGNFTLGNNMHEQNEIEFLPTVLEDAADQLIIAKWIIRMLAYKYGVTVSFAPKITVGKAGSGMHVHTRLMKDGKNMMTENGILSDIAKKAIAGYLTLAPSLTSFGNTNPTSYFRLVPHQEAPTNICWGDRNRSALVRVPLGWSAQKDMVKDANPLEPISPIDFSDKQTVEFRCPDGSADIYLLLAGLTVAARHGLEMPDALEFAKKTYVDVNIFSDSHKEKVKHLAQLPFSCYESAERLQQHYAIYTKYDVFSNKMLDFVVKNLIAFNDKDLRKRIEGQPHELEKMVEAFLYCG